MSISLIPFTSGMTTYVETLNSNNDAVTAAVNALQAASGSSASLPLSVSAFLASLFGSTTPALLGRTSYAVSTAVTVATVGVGAAWLPTTQTIVQSIAAAPLDFTGNAAATYYICLDNNGTPYISTVNNTANVGVYLVVWDGTAFSIVTPLGNYFMTAAEEQSLCHSTTNNVQYTTLLARLEAMEALINTKT